MNKRVKHDSGNLIWFNYADIDWEALDNAVIAHFDIENIPTKMECHNFLGIYEPVVIHNKTDNLKNYSVCYFEDKNSKTGYSCMCLNKDRKIYKSHAGYDEHGIPTSDEY